MDIVELIVLLQLSLSPALLQHSEIYDSRRIIRDPGNGPLFGLRLDFFSTITIRDREKSTRIDRLLNFLAYENRLPSRNTGANATESKLVYILSSTHQLIHVPWSIHLSPASKGLIFQVLSYLHVSSSFYPSTYSTYCRYYTRLWLEFQQVCDF